MRSLAKRSLAMLVALAAYPRTDRGVSPQGAHGALKSSLFEAVADAVKGLDHLKIVVHHLELLAEPLDVAVDGAVVDIDLVVIGRIHQRITAFHHAGARRQGLQNQE